MADNHIIISEKEVTLLYSIMNDWVKLMKGDNHIWQTNKFTYSTLIDKVLEAREYHESRKSDIKRTSNSGKQCIKVSFNRNCTPDVCGILTCEHAEGVETMSVIKHKKWISG